MNGPAPIPGRPVSPAEQQQLADLQALFKPADAFKRIDDFGKWIFSSIAIVGTIGAGLSNAAFQKLSGAGQVVFAVAVFALGLSLFASTMALQPQWVHARFASRTSLLAAVDENLRRRRRPVQFAAALFALALALAAAAPIASLLATPFRDHHVALTYEWKPDGKLTVGLTGTLQPLMPFELAVTTAGASAVELARIRKVTDSSGKAESSVDTLVYLPPGTELTVSGRWPDSPGTDPPLSDSQSVTTRVPTGGPSLALTYEWKADRKLTAHFVGVKLKPSTAIEVSIQRDNKGPEDLISARAAADATGKADASVELSIPFAAGTPLNLIGSWSDSSDPLAALAPTQTLKIRVPLEVHAPKAASPK